MTIKCFFLDPVDPVRSRQWLRRYASGTSCPARMGYHNAKFLLGDFDGERGDADVPPADDPRWPASCECGYVFQDEDSRQLFTNHLFRRSDNDELTTLHEVGPGAMWYAPWFSDSPEYKGPDGRTLVVRCPPDGHDWIVDSRASNCTLPEDKVHKCWVRHGTPPNITVDKNGVTCNAGAGSILTPKWHGFLRNGELVE